MSYIKPTVLLIQSPVGIDEKIQDIQLNLSSLSWLKYSFGRAWTFKEVFGSKTKRIPKVYLGNKEYYSVLPNEHLISQSFLSVRSNEKYTDFRHGQNALKKSRDISLIIWLNLNKLDTELNYVFTEVLKNDVESLLKMLPYVKINSFFDENVSDVFAGYDTDEIDTQYLMFPFTGMRFDLTIDYMETFCGKNLNSIEIIDENN